MVSEVEVLRATDDGATVIESATTWAVARMAGSSAAAPSSFGHFLASAELLAAGEMELGSSAVEREAAGVRIRGWRISRPGAARPDSPPSCCSSSPRVRRWSPGGRPAVKEDQLREAATTDPMTGIGNRGYLDEASEALRDEDGEMVLLHIDLDRFKPVNDTYGHAVGDQVLRLASTRLRTIAEDAGGIVARLGGDEFAIAVPPVTSPSVDALCDTVLEGLTVFEIEGLQLTVGASIGVARGATGIADLLLNSDLALYQAKRSGRGSASTFQAEAAEFVSFVREALLEGNVHVAYQGQYSLQTGGCIGVEVLARLERPRPGVDSRQGMARRRPSGWA